jgi:two-component system, NarL family, sensor histidine kinase UhpB
VKHDEITYLDKSSVVNRGPSEPDSSARADEILSESLLAARIGTWEFDAANEEIKCSAQCKENFGRKGSDELNFRQWVDAIDPDDRDGLHSALFNAVNNAGDLEIECRVNWPDGSTHCILLRGGKVGPQTLAGISAELTSHKHAEEAARESEDRFRINFEQAAVGMAHVGLDGCFLRINQKFCDILGFSREEMVGRDFRVITHPDDLEKSLREVEKLRRGTIDRFFVEKRYVRKDGRTVWVNLTSSLARSRDGRPEYFISVAEDITTRKQMEQALVESHAQLEAQVEERTAALRSLSARLLQMQDEERRRIARELHDSIGQYLTALTINMDLLSRPEVEHKESLVADSKEIVDKCLTETRTLSHLLHPPLLDETGFFSAAQWYVQGFAQRSGIRVDIDVPSQERLPSTVEIMLFRVLQEALTNIHRHSGSSAAEVRMEVDAEKVLLEIRDYGRGMSPETLRGFHARRARVGVGLAGMRERVAEVGGKLELKSDSSGTTVRVRVPVSPADDRMPRHGAMA